MKTLLLFLSLLLLTGCAAHPHIPAGLTEGTADLSALASADELPLRLTILDDGEVIDAGQPDILAESWNGQEDDPLEYWRYLYRKFDGADESPLAVTDDAELILDFGDCMPKSVTARLDTVTYATDGYVCGETPQSPEALDYIVNYTLNESGEESETLSIPITFSDEEVIYLVLDCQWSGGNRVTVMTALRNSSN